jgi:DNA-directed RNA polymerase II subunit RPB2
MSKTRSSGIADELDHWTVIKSLLNENHWRSLVRHHLDSYNDFMKNKIPIIVKQFNPLSIYHDYDVDKNIYNYEIKIEFGNVSYNKPYIHENDGSTKIMYPQDARLRNISYSLPVLVDMKVNIYKNPFEEDKKETLMEKELKNINIGKIPIMVGSNFCLLNDKTNLRNDECKYDLGGYFIVNGNEKVIVCQEKIAENRVYVFENNKASSKYSHIAEVKSTLFEGFNTPKNFSIKYTSKENVSGRCIKASIPHVKVDVPVFVLFRALGITSDKEILNYIMLNMEKETNEVIMWLKPTVEDGSVILTQEDALDYLVRNGAILGQPKDIRISREEKIKIFKGMLERDLLPHIGPDFNQKALFLGYMINKLSRCYFKKINFDDRDSYCNKRVETSGYLMAVLFRQYFTKLIKDMRNSIMKELNSGPWKNSQNVGDIINTTNLYKILKSTTIESGLKYGLATGNWGIKSMNSKVGIAQVLSRLTYTSTLSHLRRINTPTEKTGKLVAPRKLHNTQWGIICPSETPEGGSVGLVKNISIGTYVTIGSSSEPIKKILKDNNTISLSDISNVGYLHEKTKVFLNGTWMGIHEDSIKLYDLLIHYKRTGKINIFTSISFNYESNEINIFTDSGRCCRPLYIVDGKTPRITHDHINRIKVGDYKFNNLLVNSLNTKSINNKQNNDIREGVVEYIDTEESWNSLIAANILAIKQNKTVQYSHSEIHPCLMLGILGSLIPFCNNNQSPRNTYQSAMGKQAMGIYATNYMSRLDTMAHILYYPTKPIVNTRIGNFLPSSNVPNGMNVIVAIASYSGYNQEDSVILNRGSIHRGLFSSTLYKTYKDSENKIQSSGQDQKFIKPDKSITKGMKPGSYEKLDINGFIREGEYVDANDIIIGKVMPIKKTSNNQIYRDVSTVLRNNESGYIDKVYYNYNGEGHKFCKIRTRKSRIPTIGDKFSSRHGQKGTVGMVFNEEDMPYTKDGIRPDIIVNPHAIPSRMTIAQLLECIMGKACSNIGCMGDGTPFNGVEVGDISKILKQQKFEEHGNEVLYSGFTGKQLDSKIFIGPTYYQRLKHMVEDKIHSRANGPMVLLTRQPAEGRSRDGGLRFGEMERDCMIAHGASQFLKERLLDASDNYRIFTCNLCGLISPVNPDRNIYKCKKCNNYSDFSEVRIPYACKLLIQELESMNIASRIKTS